MHEKYDTRAFVLKARPYKEDSVEVVLFSETLGKIRAIAQAAKRPGATFAASVEPGTLGSYALVRGRYHWRITGMHDLTQYSFSLEKELKDAYLRILSILSRFLPEQEAHIEVFTKLENFLEDTPEDLERREAEIVFLLLVALGYADKTANVSKTEDLILEVNKGILAADL
jgi:DNA repair protein RecO